MKKVNKNNNREEINIERILSLKPEHKATAPEGLADRVLHQWSEKEKRVNIITFNPKKHWYWAASIAVFCLNLWALSLYVLPNHQMQTTQVNNEIDMSQVYFPNTIGMEYIDLTENGQ